MSKLTHWLVKLTGIGTELQVLRDEAAAYAADAQAHAAAAADSHRKALQCALAAGEAAGVTARPRGVGDRAAWGLDSDLETLDPH